MFHALKEMICHYFRNKHIHIEHPAQQAKSFIL